MPGLVPIVQPNTASNTMQNSLANTIGKTYNPGSVQQTVRVHKVNSNVNVASYLNQG